MLALTGLEALRRIHAGRSPQPPIHYVSGRRLLALQHGQASFSMPASGWFCGPKGSLHSGIFAFLLDMTHSARCCRRCLPTPAAPRPSCR
jgi:acyl-coenzyme A thioesterase PaaI-like protein